MKKLTAILISFSFLLLSAMPLDAQIPQVDKMGNKSLIERGEPVLITIRLKGDQKKHCQATRLAIVIDVSGSLYTYHGQVTAALFTALPQITPKTDEIAIASFANSFNILQNWTNNVSLVPAALNKLQSGGGTNISKAISGTNSLMQQISGNPDCMAALIVTDGQDDLPSSALLNMAKTNGWKYYFLGVGNQDKNKLKWMATESGGIYLDSSSPPYSNSIYGGVVAAVLDFINSAMKIVAPTNIVITEVTNPKVTVLKTHPPNVPPNQANPTTYTSAAATEWSKLKTTGKAVLPSIDKLGKDIYGAPQEYSVDFEVTVNECDDQKPITYPVDGPGAKVTYTVNSQNKTVYIPNYKITVKPCDVPIEKSWNAKERTIELEIKNNYSYTIDEVELFENLNHPLIIYNTSPAASVGGSNDSYAKFSLPKMTSGSTEKVKVWIKPSTPITGIVGKYPVNDLTDSYFSFTVPIFASEFKPTSPHHKTLESAISAGVVGSAAKLVLEKTAFAVPHAQDTEVDKKQKILSNSSTIWPMFNWSIEGDEGTFFIEKVGVNYKIYIAHKKWKKLPKLDVPVEELNP